MTTLTLTRYWTATVATEGAADATGAQLGGIFVDGLSYAHAGTYDIDEGTPKTFTSRMSTTTRSIRSRSTAKP